MQEIPVLLQFRSVDFRSRLDESPLRDGQATSQTFDRVHSEDGRVVLVVRVEMRSMVLAAGFDEHSDDDPEEPR